MKIRVSLSAYDADARLEKMTSLAQQLEKLKCKVTISGGKLLPRLYVIATKYPFNWCITHLGWGEDKTKHHDMANTELVRADGSFRLAVAWRGNQILTPMGNDWNEK